jgi:hypothetical protein
MGYKTSAPVEVLRVSFHNGKIRYRGWTYEWVYEREDDNAFYMHHVEGPSGERAVLDYTGTYFLSDTCFALWVDMGGIDRSIINKNGPLDHWDMGRFLIVLNDFDVDCTDPEQMKTVIRLALA